MSKGDGHHLVRWRRRATRRALRRCALQAYGGRCVCCGESMESALTFDHILGGGEAHRREVGKNQFVLWLIATGFPSEIQVLCRNCHDAKTRGGRCEHERQREQEQEREVAQIIGREAW